MASQAPSPGEEGYPPDLFDRENMHYIPHAHRLQQIWKRAIGVTAAWESADREEALNAIAENMATGQRIEGYEEIIWMAQQFEFVQELQGEPSELHRAAVAMSLEFQTILRTRLGTDIDRVMHDIYRSADVKTGNTVVQPDLGAVHDGMAETLRGMTGARRDDLLKLAAWFAFPASYPCRYVEERQVADAWYSDLAQCVAGLAREAQLEGCAAWADFKQAHHDAPREMRTALDQEQTDDKGDNQFGAKGWPNKVVQAELAKCRKVPPVPATAPWLKWGRAVVLVALVIATAFYAPPEFAEPVLEYARQAVDLVIRRAVPVCPDAPTCPVCPAPVWRIF